MPDETKPAPLAYPPTAILTAEQAMEWLQIKERATFDAMNFRSFPVGSGRERPRVRFLAKHILEDLDKRAA